MITAVAAALAVAASSVLLTGGEVPSRFLRLAVVNNTDQDLTIRIGYTWDDSVRPNTTEVAEIGPSDLLPIEPTSETPAPSR